MSDAEQSFATLWESLLPVGRDSGTGGYRRFSWTPADASARSWFMNAAAVRNLRTYADRNGNLWAWWDPAGAGVATEPDSFTPGAIVTGSHLDSVPDGGAYDGPLGVATAFAAIDMLRERGRRPARPVAVAAFTEEEGARFGVACLGSRLLTGVTDPAKARALTDRNGVTLAGAMTAAGLDPDAIGPDEALLASIGSCRSVSLVVPAWSARPVNASRQRPCGQIPAASPTAAPRSASARPCSMCSST